MALVIDYTQDLLVDEDQGAPVNDPDEVLYSSLTGEILTVLTAIDATNDFATGLTTPQVAMEDSFFSVDGTGGALTGLALTQDGGVAFPTTAGDGVLAPFTTASGDDIYLFQGPDEDTVIGVIGDDPTGDVAFVIHLEETTTSGQITGGRLWIVQSEPVYHLDGTAVEGDTQDLTNLIYVATTQVTTSVASDFSDVPAGAPIFAMIADDQGGSVQFLTTAFKASAPSTGITVNVSNQGSFPGSLAAGSQNITPGTGLRFDLVTGGDTVYTPTEGQSASNIDFADHADNITRAGFSVVQNQGGRPTDVLIAAYTIPDSLDGSNTDGTNFFSTLGNQGSPETIDAVRVYTINPTTGLPVAGTDHTYLRTGGNVAGVVTFNSDGTAKVLNLGLNSTVEIVVDEGGLDRFTVTNVDNQHNAYIDIGRLTYTSETTNSDAQEIGSRIFIDDSGPTVTAGALGSEELQTSDATLTTDDTTDFSGLFTVDYGSDGAASADGLVYSLTTAGGATGIYDTATGEEVQIAHSGDDLVGTVNSGADIVFVISVDSDTGEVTLDQRRAVQHLTSGGDETDAAAALSGTDLVVLHAAATDQDTDQDSDSVDITAAVSFLDSHPDVSLTSEDAPQLDVDDDTLGADSGDFSILFSADFGNDGEGPSGVTYTLGVNTGSTGLRDCATGDAILLKMDGDDVIGYVGTDTEVFRVSVDADGNVTLSQSRAIEHIVSGTPTDTALTLSAANLITLTATAEDGDKDTDSATANIGTSLYFSDAQPEFTDAADDMTLLFATGSTQTETYAVDFHNDTPGSVTITPDSLVYDGPFTPVVGTDSIQFYEGSTLIYHVDVTSTGYTVTVDNDPTPTSTDLNFDAVKAGGPKETLAVPLVDNSDTIVFDGLIDGVEWTSTDRDYLNPDALGFGVKGGQASQINPHEGFLFYNTGTDPFSTLTFGIQGIGNLNTVTVHFTLFDDNGTPTNRADDTQVGSGNVAVSGLAGGNVVKYVDIEQAGVDYDLAVVTFSFPTKNGVELDNQGIRLLDFSTVIENPHIGDSFSFEVTATDCDLDTVSSGQINVTLDPFLI